MAEYIFPPSPVVAVRIAGSTASFPVRRVFCVGRNYADHAREMGANPDREPPFFFTKPADAVVPAAGTLAYPMLTEDLHHEIEMVIAIGKEGSRIDPENALEYVLGYSVGVDLTRRDLQAIAKKMSRPWDWAKGFDESAPVTPIHLAEKHGHPGTGKIWLSVNGETRQTGDLADMIWPVADIISHVSHAVVIKPGDLIFSGTPAGVGALNRGDTVTGGVEGVAEFQFEIGGA
ncbi:fumarylacetoacetate hydrolase [Burkholderia sp. Leaf177]|uniref:fumarylacetoacetate hydrolase family protein n=1 Tax=Burkholderia sp. Leaf177 TaxID=1736287 RepID=UPI0006F24D0A|nr:fumarylacetoacetate hydrolase family protein [Burkholderia sp. Leaf177]KQR76424.1 fumarylacetoacetate hydrolase [Burkholderia sp. Leaf177]